MLRRFLPLLVSFSLLADPKDPYSLAVTEGDPSSLVDGVVSAITGDLYISIRFKTTSEGGRKTFVTGDFYACPMIVDDKAYDCRLLINGMVLKLGDFYEVPVKFFKQKSDISAFKCWEKRNYMGR